jgi:hypothetical protein
MSVQYISDDLGNTTGVFIPIQDWNKLKSKFNGLEEEEFELPSWQKNELNDRMAEYERNPSNTISFQDAMDDLEKDA